MPKKYDNSNNLFTAIHYAMPEFLYHLNAEDSETESINSVDEVKMNPEQLAAISGIIQSQRYTDYIMRHMELWNPRESEDPYKLQHWSQYLLKDLSYLCEKHGHVTLSWASAEDGTEDVDCIICGWGFHTQW